jgi:hypothetical protein
MPWAASRHGALEIPFLIEAARDHSAAKRQQRLGILGVETIRKELSRPVTQSVIGTLIVEVVDIALRRLDLFAYCFESAAVAAVCPLDRRTASGDNRLGLFIPRPKR